MGHLYLSVPPPERQQSVTHPDVPLIRSTDTPLRVDTQRPLGLILWNGTHSWSLVRACYMAGEVTHWKRTQEETIWRWIRGLMIKLAFYFVSTTIYELASLNTKLSVCYTVPVYDFRVHPLCSLAPTSTSPLLTFTSTTLAYESHHEGSALVTLGGRAERLHHKLMCFGLLRVNTNKKENVVINLRMSLIVGITNKVRLHG